MLSVEEALLFKAVQDEQERMDAEAIGGAIGAIGGGLSGLADGSRRHDKATRGKAIEGMGRIRPGFRAAGGLTGAILGGALGAGSAAIMKRDSPAAQMLGDIQAQRGELTEYQENVLASLLGEIYGSPSQLG